MGDVSGLQVDLQSQEQREQQFVILVETPGGITEHLKEGQQGFTIVCRHFSSLKEIHHHLLAFCLMITTQPHSGTQDQNLVGQEVDDVTDAFGGDLRLGGPLHRQVEEPQELSQRCLVHDVYQRHFYDQEVEDAPPGGHRPVLLSGVVDFQLRLCRNCELLTHLDGEEMVLIILLQTPGEREDTDGVPPGQWSW